MAESDLAPLPTFDQVRKMYRLKRSDVQAKLDELSKARAVEIARRTAAEAEAQRNAIEAARVQADAETRRAAAAAEAERIRQAGAAAEAQRQAEAERVARENSPYNQGRQLVENIGAPLVGYGVGHRMGEASGARMNAVEAARAANLDKLMSGASKLSPYSADDIATAKAKVAAARQQGLTSGRGIGQFATPGMLALMGTGTIAGSQYLDNEYAKDASQAFGRGEQLAGLGMALKQAHDTKHRIDPLNANSVAGLERLKQFPNEPLAAPLAPEPVAAAPVSPEPTATPTEPMTKAPKFSAEELQGKTATDLKSLYKEQFPDKKFPVPEPGVGGLKNAIINKLTSTSGIAGLAIGTTVYDALRSPARAEDGDAGTPTDATTAALAGAGAGYGAYKGANAVGRALDAAGRTAAPYVERALGPVAPLAGKAAGLVGSAASKVATPLAVAELGRTALAPSDTAEDSRMLATVNTPAEAPSDSQSFVAFPQWQGGAKPYDPGAVADEGQLADQVISAMRQKPEAMGEILERTHAIASDRGWNPADIGQIISARMQPQTEISAQP